MIAHVTGVLTARSESTLVVDISGIGYRVYTPKETASVLEVGDDIELFTHLVVKEDALDLYGFSTNRERDFFELLISISGIGPKGALGVLNLASLDTLEQAIVTGDSGYLTKVSGIGKKTGEKIILELKDKLAAVVGERREGVASGVPGAQEDIDAIEALAGLGYSHREAREAVSGISKDVRKTDEKIREALKMLGRK